VQEGWQVSGTYLKYVSKTKLECTFSLLVFYLSFLVVGWWGIIHFLVDVHMSIFVMNLMWASKAEACRQYK
jgi:hypothetical protein